MTVHRTVALFIPNPLKGMGIPRAFFKIEDKNQFKISSLADLERVIPVSRAGKALNYGQGEGQIQIENTIWGFYITDHKNYRIQFEEGYLSWEQFQLYCEEIFNKIRSEFGDGIEFITEGMLQHYEPHEKYLS